MVSKSSRKARVVFTLIIAILISGCSVDRRPQERELGDDVRQQSQEQPRIKEKRRRMNPARKAGSTDKPLFPKPWELRRRNPV